MLPNFGIYYLGGFFFFNVSILKIVFSSKQKTESILWTSEGFAESEQLSSSKQWFRFVAPAPSDLRESVCACTSTTWHGFCSSPRRDALESMCDNLCCSSHWAIPMSFALGACQFCQLCLGMYILSSSERQGILFQRKIIRFCDC